MIPPNPVCVSGMATLSWALPDEIAMHARIGTDLVGLPIHKVVAFGTPALQDLLALHGMRVGYLVQAFTAQPDDDAEWERQMASLIEGVRAAHRLGAAVVYLTCGPSGHLRWQEAADRFAARMTPAVEEARSLGVRLAVENTLPVRADLSFTHSASDAFALAEQVGVGVCLDLYCCWQERGLEQLIADQLERIEILQVSDLVVGTSVFPNRWVPGDADLPLERLLASALDAGYRGIIDVELIGPAIELEGAESALTRSVSWLRDRLAASVVQEEG
ncbi:sugar phosphate isomerase/epimerase family protein [Microbacterium sp. Mu-80]|uniref:Sugar phosphate isomerase/epimerase family protein n=1 Tax=Microbacterium bandirmense TaxID=3122050 RepID=A0ABU8L8X2_9MICO